MNSIFKRSHISLGKTTIHLVQYIEFNPSDYLVYLNENEQAKLNSFNHVKRKMEFVATRILKHELFGHKTIQYLDHGAPYIYKEGFISISHSNFWSAIAVNEDYQIGLDLELKSTKANRIHRKFLTEHELQLFEEKNDDLFSAAWSCKETMYKLAGRKKIIFKEELLLEKFNQFGAVGKIINPEETIYVNLSILDHQDIIITINNSACIYERHS